MDDRAGQACMQLRVGLAGIELPQHHLAVGPGQVEDAVRKVPVEVFLDQAHGRVAGVTDARHDVDRDRLFRIEGNAMTDGDDRIQHRRRFSYGR